MHPVRRQISPHAARLRRDMTDVERTLWFAVRDRRTAFIEAQGYRIIRFWNNEVIESLEGVLEVILAALRAETGN